MNRVWLLYVLPEGGDKNPTTEVMGNLVEFCVTGLQ